MRLPNATTLLFVNRIVNSFAPPLLTNPGYARPIPPPSYPHLLPGELGMSSLLSSYSELLLAFRWNRRSIPVFCFHFVILSPMMSTFLLNVSSTFVALAPMVTVFPRRRSVGVFGFKQLNAYRNWGESSRRDAEWESVSARVYRHISTLPIKITQVHVLVPRPMFWVPTPPASGQGTASPCTPSVQILIFPRYINTS